MVEGRKSSPIMGRVEQRMKKASYAVISLFFAVPRMRAECRDSHNGLLDKELRGIIRRSQSAVSEFTLLITLFSGKPYLVAMILKNAPLWLYFKSVKSSEKSVKLYPAPTFRFLPR